LIFVASNDYVIAAMEFARPEAVSGQSAERLMTPTEHLRKEPTFRVNSQADVAADLRRRGCAVCNHVIRAAHDFFAHWQYALASDEKAQSEFAGELGFCPTHMWQLHEMS
jgi:hypothetical protein